MARLRTLKPSFFTHEDLAELTPLHRLLFQGLWCHADREGRLEDRPRFLKTVILPYDKGDIEAMLEDLARAGFIERYQAAGKRVIRIPNFARHQKPHPKEPPSELPPPPMHENLSTAEPCPAAEKNGSTMPEPGPDNVRPGGLGDFGLGDFGLGGPGVVTPVPPGPELIREAWNRHAPPLSRWKDQTKSRKESAKSRWEEHPDPGYWSEVCARIAASDFCKGKNDRGWRAGPDFLLRPDTAVKVLEGAYDNRAGASLRHETTDAEFLEKMRDVQVDENGDLVL